MQEPAELVAGDEVLARLRKRIRKLADVTGNGHRVDVGARNLEAVENIAARQSEGHPAIYRHFDRIRTKAEHGGDDGHYDSAIGAAGHGRRRKLWVLSDSGWIDGLDVTRRLNSLHPGH